MSAGPVTGHEMGHPLQPNTMLVPARPVPGLGAIPPPACSVLTPAQPGRHGDYRECVLDLRTKATWQNINNMFTDSALQLVLHIPLYTPVLTWPAHVPSPCKSPLFPLLPVAIHCCKHLKTRPVPIMLLCRKCVSNFSAQYLSSPKPGRLLWERNCSAQKNECCITAAINTELFLFLQHLQYQDITKPVPN